MVRQRERERAHCAAGGEHDGEQDAHTSKASEIVEHTRRLPQRMQRLYGLPALRVSHVISASISTPIASSASNFNRPDGSSNAMPPKIALNE